MKLPSLIILFCLLPAAVFSQQKTIEVTLTARVDTTKEEIKEIYRLWTDYLNSDIDSIYDNPYWNTKEKELYRETDMPFDRGMWVMYFRQDPSRIMRAYKPKVLSIEPEGEKYRIRTLFYRDSLSKAYQAHNPPWISIYYAIRENEQWKLQNAIVEMTTK